MRSLENSMCQEWQVHHSSDLTPQDLLHFVYLDEFRDDWNETHSNDNDELELWALEILIMADPLGGKVIPGTGGLRKIRFRKEGKGKRGGIRVLYAFFPEHHIVLMVGAFAKCEKEDLTEVDKQGIREYLEFTSDWLNGKENGGS